MRISIEGSITVRELKYILPALSSSANFLYSIVNYFFAFPRVMPVLIPNHGEKRFEKNNTGLFWKFIFSGKYDPFIG